MSKRHRHGVSAASVLRHVEEVVLATSGEDTFEIAFAVAAARIVDRDRRRVPKTARDLRRDIAETKRRHPSLGVALGAGVEDALLVRVDTLFLHAFDGESGVATLDAVFESLVPRIAKADKGQFFTPRHVVEHVIAMLAPRADEVVVDPACGSGAFLTHARAAAPGARTYGSDVDPRAVRIARLLTLADGADPSTVERVDGLHSDTTPFADVVATNPPFAGRAPAEGFAVASLVRTPERDVLFLERALRLLRPHGRLGIVLPYNKASGQAFGALRRWLLEQARVLAIVGLPRETFLPHTSQRTFVLFARKRARAERPKGTEPTMFLVSERAGKAASGEPILRAGRLDHDLDEVAAKLGPFLREEGFHRAPKPVKLVERRP